MKELNRKEKQQAILGVLLMGGLILLYFLLTVGVESIKLFHYFLPGFWLMYTLVLIFSMIFQRKERLTLYKEELITPYVSNFTLMRNVNIITVVVLIIGYFTSTLGGLSATYYNSQVIYFTVVICILVALNVVGVTLCRK